MVCYCAEIDLNGMDNMGDDSDSVGNAPRTTRSATGAGGTGGGAGFTMPSKEKRKPFFKKVHACFVNFFIQSLL